MNTDHELHALLRMEREGGGFAGSLATAWLQADGGNKAKLRSLFSGLLADFAAPVQTPRLAPARTYRSEFPEFGEMPEMDALVAAGWTDTSWHNDVCPSFENNAQTMRLWVQCADPEQRECGGPRFGIVRVAAVQGESILEDGYVAEGETYAEVADIIAKGTPPLRLLRLTDEGDRYAFEFGGIDIHTPTKSECGRFQYDPAHPETESILREYGFTIWETGGGCTAWRQDFVLVDGRRAYMLVTDADASHTAEPGNTIIGVYLEDDGVNEWTGESILEWTDETEAELCDSLTQFCEREGLVPASADEMLVQGDLTDTQREWLERFVRSWDNWELCQRNSHAARTAGVTL